MITLYSGRLIIFSSIVATSLGFLTMPCTPITYIMNTTCVRKPDHRAIDNSFLPVAVFNIRVRRCILRVNWRRGAVLTWRRTRINLLFNWRIWRRVVQLTPSSLIDTWMKDEWRPIQIIRRYWFLEPCSAPWYWNMDTKLQRRYLEMRTSLTSIHTAYQGGDYDYVHQHRPTGFRTGLRLYASFVEWGGGGGSDITDVALFKTMT